MADEQQAPKMGPQHVTVDGIKLTVDPEVFNDWDVTKLLWMATAPSSSQDSNPFAVYPLSRKLFGKDYGRIIGELRKRGNGVVTTDSVMNFIQKVTQRAVPNSQH